MNHFTWTYVGDAGYSAKVGLYHSSKTGHLMVYVEKKVIIVDFNIRDSKNYSFFINDELCNLILERKGDQMYYHFEIDKKADTPRNRARKKIEKKYFRQSALFFGFFVLALVGIVFYFNNTLKTQKATVQLIQNPAQTVGKVNIDFEDEEPIVSYFFVAKNQSYSSKSDVGEQPTIILSNGMPLESGDEFLVEYSTKNPKINKIRFNAPTENQLQVYQNRVLQKHQQLHPELDKTHIRCLLKVAFEIKGIAALADFYFQNTDPEDNTKNNRNTYLKLTRDLPYQNKVKKNCW